MSKKAKDLTGCRVGRLVVLSKEEEKAGRQNIWKCKCDCGNTVFVRACHLTSNHTRSCGCLKVEIAKQANRKHGKANERIAKIWYGMKKRCYCKTSSTYKNYGGRGIAICNEWRNDFHAFYDWAMSNGYADNLTIDRIDVNGNYCPENCRWIPNEEQANNRRNNHLITYKGETHTMKDWAKIIGINYSTLRSRINVYKWSVEKAFDKKIKRSN